MIDITEIYVHWCAGRSKSALAASLGVDRKTARRYLAPAEASGITPGGPPLPFSWLRNGASGLRVRHDFPHLLLMIRGVVSPGLEASTDR
ncbi:hypothetical protein [Streptomyces sp. PAN_FS17]|uniref:hypothetical protein n=1 Tax=Streptomyces sp. PAN_FS17 TaxID=1855351 RepID=UPI000897042E|nr:hypothetical protein [Streptomyces sp. PAN_FS17]SEB60422.1 hypothetical protein SAMN05216482_0157 [Streptomyces sp. PAN_FS17]